MADNPSSSKPRLGPVRWLLGAAGAAVALLGWAGAAALDGPDAAGFFGGAATLAGALWICLAFSFHAPWHGIAGAVAVALLGAARNAPAAAAMLATPPPRPELCRLAIAAVCLAALVSAGRAVLGHYRTRREGQAQGRL